jgi:hypothetical protein
MLKKSVTEIGTNKKVNLSRYISVHEACVVSTMPIGFPYTKERVSHSIFLTKFV